MVLIAVYGTLRKGHYNYHHYALNLQYVAKHLGTTTLKGYKLYDYKGLPIATETYEEEDEIIVDLFDIQHTKTYWQLQLMEQTAGYFTDITSVSIKDVDKEAIIWTMTENQLTPIKNELKEVKNGDWDDWKNYELEEADKNANTTKE